MTPALLNAFWAYTLTIAMTPRPNNIPVLSSATPYGFRQSTCVLAGMSLRFLIVMLLCADISFSLAVIDPAAVCLLSQTGAAYTVQLAWKIAISPTEEDGLQAKPISFWASSASRFVNVKIILYGVATLSTFALPQIQALSWVAGVSVLLIMTGTFGNARWALAGYLSQRLFRQYGRQLNIVLALSLVYCAVRTFY